MVAVTLKETNPYICLFEKKGRYIIHIFDGEESVDIPLQGNPKNVLSQIALYVGDY